MLTAWCSYKPIGVRRREITEDEDDDDDDDKEEEEDVGVADDCDVVDDEAVNYDDDGEDN